LAIPYTRVAADPTLSEMTAEQYTSGQTVYLYGPGVTPNAAASLLGLSMEGSNTALDPQDKRFKTDQVMGKIYADFWLHQAVSGDGDPLYDYFTVEPWYEITDGRYHEGNGWYFEYFQPGDPLSLARR
jgi:hypothetical protein